MSAIGFTWGPGDGYQLYAPGFPDIIAGTKDAYAWVNRCGVWYWVNSSIWFQALPDVQGLVLSEQECIVVSAKDRQFSVRTLQRENGSIGAHRSFSARGIEVGANIVVVDQGTERIALDLHTGQTLTLPVGARDARPKPWAVGPGVVWIDQLQVYRLAFGGRPQSVGRLPSPATSWVVGPRGSAVFMCDGRSFGMTSIAGLVDLPLLDAESVRFDPSGDEILAVSEDGTVHIRLVDGQVIGRSRGCVVPVGFVGKPVVLDEDAGVLKWMGGREIRDGFSPCAVSIHGNQLYGPGATAWDVRTQKRLWSHSPLAGIHLVAHPDGVFQIDDRIVGFDTSGRMVSNVPFPIDEDIDGEVLEVSHSRQGFRVRTEQGMVSVGFNGHRLAFETSTAPAGSEDEEEGNTTQTESLSINGVDGLHADPSGRVWCWNEDGILFSLPDSHRLQGR